MAPRRFKTISEYHQFRRLPKPEHPLISVVNFESFTQLGDDEPKSIVQDFYVVALKKNVNCTMYYGQGEYDFNEGAMFFMSPGQVFSIEAKDTLTHSGWLLLIHPDFLWNTSLVKTIKQYEYFGYSVNEALFLSEKEEMTITSVLKNIAEEYHSNIDKYSQNIIISQIETLLNYAERFYQRQFITRQKSNALILHRMEELLDGHFDNSSLVDKGLPTVKMLAESLHLSPNYLNAVLKTLTGQSTQQHIHEKLIARAKERLSTTSLSVSEIAFELGYEHPQSFNKLFKTKTKQSPLEFRASFN
ncbi:helix-turn-helix transcriptional regulator [Muricauda oceani]|uniref:Helix-turn-helix transcriptional regulator n=1 Tax=Flagellimonas oceani TaxID=2698672 RepID=A0A6G7IYT4_9FLAO|nr:response regulator transcription factor [Allomuricauda oceani]MBW8244899.1 helix-turn-helix transcriptional regulator [Allomuricauda oceani]QII43560.1 helix-turn-helix transcriptional regulator [Allomuricauda oceani]